MAGVEQKVAIARRPEDRRPVGSQRTQAGPQARLSGGAGVRKEIEAVVEHDLGAPRVDAIVVQGEDGPRVVLLEGASEPYRVLVERMSDGALTFDGEGTILKLLK